MYFLKLTSYSCSDISSLSGRDSVTFALSSEAEESILFLVKVMICPLSYNELDVVCAIDVGLLCFLPFKVVLFLG